MRLLLRQVVSTLGAVGDVIEVSDGYGRNYLLPQRLAVANTPENRKALEADKLRALQKEAERGERAKVAAKSLKNALLQVNMKAQPDGSLYGSVSKSLICDVVKRSRGIEIDESWIATETVIKKIGDYDVLLQLPGDVKTTFKLTVLPEE